MPTINVLSKNKKIVKTNSNENCHFYGHEKSLYVAWACFRNVLLLHLDRERDRCVPCLVHSLSEIRLRK